MSWMLAVCHMAGAAHETSLRARSTLRMYLYSQFLFSDINLFDVDQRRLFILGRAVFVLFAPYLARADEGAYDRECA